MRAAIYEQAGPAEDVLQIREMPDPEPQPGQVRVRIHYSGVNPTDWKRRSGEAPQYGPFQIPNQDGSGLIDRVGAGVDPARVGDRVWVYHAAIGHMFGTAADYVCLPEQQAVGLPEHVSLAQGATLGIPYLTAAHALRYAGSLKDARVLIQGGAGAVGNAAIQLATHQGATVVTTVSCPEKADLARAARPDVILNYLLPDFVDLLATAAADGFDLVTEVDLGRNLPAYVSNLSLGAHVVAYASDGSPAAVPLRLLMFRNANVHCFVVYLLPRGVIDAAVALVRSLLASGEIVSLPIREYGLDDVARTHNDVQDGLVGRALIRLS